MFSLDINETCEMFAQVSAGFPGRHNYYSESKYSVELLSRRYLCNCLSYTH